MTGDLWTDLSIDFLLLCGLICAAVILFGREKQ